VQIDLTNFLFKMSAAKDTDEMWNLLLEGTDYCGFDLLLYGFSRFTTGTSVGDPNDFLILSNHQIDYSEGFVDTAHLMNAPFRMTVPLVGVLYKVYMPKINWTNKRVRLLNSIVNIR